MPDTTDQRLPGEVFERDFERNVLKALGPPPPGKLRAGILRAEHYKSFIVNIRPTKWQNTLWIGKIDNYVNAQFIADFVYRYIGHPGVHFKTANFKFPPLECGGTSLTSREMCLKYATSIAKGNEFKSQRAEFKKKVRELAREELKSAEVQRVLLQFRDESGSALIPAEDVAGNNNNNEEEAEEEEDVQADHPSPMEVDDPNEQAAHLALILASHDAVDRNVEGRSAHVPGFDMSDPGFTLQSDWTPVDFFLVGAYYGCLEYDDSEDHHGSHTNDEDPFENFRANFFAMEDASED